MSRHVLEVAGLRYTTRAIWIAGTDRPLITWWPTSPPGTDLDGQPRRRSRKPTRPRIRRGRIQLIAA
jgi:hypothetical protein